MGGTFLLGQKSKQLSALVFSLRIISSMSSSGLEGVVLNAFQLKIMYVSLNEIIGTNVCGG